MDADVDICVIGAGLVGMFNALQASKRGLTVAIVDDLANPRSFKVGESLLNYSHSFLRTVGDADDAIRESFEKEGFWMSFGMEDKDTFKNATEWSFRGKPPADWMRRPPSGPLADLVFMDAQIARPDVEAAMETSLTGNPLITTINRGKVRNVALGEGGAPSVVKWSTRDGNEEGSISARWVIDCSGRTQVLARQFGHSRGLNDEFKTAAVWAQFSGVSDEAFGSEWSYRHADGTTVHRDRGTCHFWGPGHWIWVIRLSKDRVSVGITFDHRTPPEGDTYRDRFWNAIERYPIIARLIRNAEMLEMHQYRDIQHITETYIHERRYALVGDAASIVDAFYSQGISLALSESWHIANVIEKDVRKDVLDTDYITHINRSAYSDWMIMRSMVREKYSGAIADSRFFELSHLLDFCIFGAAALGRYRITQWLVDTGGRTHTESKSMRRLRLRLSSHLFLSRSGVWGLLPPERAASLFETLQSKLATRARWRLAHDIELPPVQIALRVDAAIPPLWKLFFNRGQGSPVAAHRMRSTPFSRLLSYSGRESHPIALIVASPGLFACFLLGYVIDGIDTSVRKLLVMHRRNQR